MPTTAHAAEAKHTTCTATLRTHEMPVRLVVIGDVVTDDACQQLAVALTEAVTHYPRVALDLTRAGVLSGAAARIVADHREGLRVVLVACESDASRTLRAHRTRLPLAYQPRPGHYHPHRGRRTRLGLAGVSDRSRPGRDNQQQAAGLPRRVASRPAA
jgi:hypothetical protein